MLTLVTVKEDKAEDQLKSHSAKYKLSNASAAICKQTWAEYATKVHLILSVFHYLPLTRQYILSVSKCGSARHSSAGTLQQHTDEWWHVSYLVFWNDSEECEIWNSKAHFSDDYAMNA